MLCNQWRRVVPAAGGDEWKTRTCSSLLISSIIMRIVLLALLAPSILEAEILSAAPIYSRTTDRYYEFIEESVNWHEARQRALGREFRGSRGYLATTGTRREILVLVNLFGFDAPGQFAWIGGYEPVQNASWLWADGPEAGVRFSQSEHPVFPSFFVNWAPGEPDAGAANEDYVKLNLGSNLGGVEQGQWTAVAANPSGNNPVRGFLVEYAVVPEPSTAALGLFGLVCSLTLQRRTMAG